MSHVEVIVTQKVLPPPDSQTATLADGEMTAQVTFTPSDSATPAQISSQVERIVKRLAKLADD